VYLDALDHFVKDRLRVRGYVLYSAINPHPATQTLMNHRLVFFGRVLSVTVTNNPGQEFVLRWGTADGRPLREVVRQQWVFSPDGSMHETEDYRVDLRDVTVLELAISPDISGGDALAARAPLAELRLA
jgi:hypothetical protein